MDFVFQSLYASIDSVIAHTFTLIKLERYKRIWIQIALQIRLGTRSLSRVNLSQRKLHKFVGKLVVIQCHSVHY